MKIQINEESKKVLTLSEMPIVKERNYQRF